jgi:diguanylate cyclase (GGDEF)-like protein/PAS domain S-box-containing protein
MKPGKSLLEGDASEEVAALIATLHATGQRLEELTAGEVDTVADRQGRTFLLRQAQEQLRHIEEAKQAAVLNALPAHIALLDANGLIISVNDAWRRFGSANVVHGPGCGVGLNYLEICDSARGDGSSEAHQVAAGIHSVLDGDVKSFSIEYPCHSPTEQRWFLLTVAPMADGRPNGAVVMHLDVTAKRRTEESLHASELRFRQMAENIRDAFWLTDPAKNQILYVSPAYEEIWGRSRENLYAQPRDWIDAIHPEDRERVLQAAKTKQAKGEYVEEYRIVRPDGGIRWLRDRAFPVVHQGGEVYRIAGLAEDITERKLVADKLRESERRFSGLLGNVEMVSLMLDREARITYCNEYALRLTGWRREEVIGRNWFELFIPPEADDVKDSFAALLANLPEALHHENEILTRSGERRLIRWNNSVLRSGAGDVVGTASIGEDITEQKRAEIRIKRLNRVYAVLSQINALIVRVKGRGELFDGACRIAVAAGGFRMAWIGMVDRKAMKIEPVASAGSKPEFMAFVRHQFSLAEELPRGKSLTAQAIREKRAFFSNDTQNDPKIWFKEKHVERGTRSMAVLPLLVSDEAVGALVLYTEEADFFDAAELTLLTELAGNISFALDHIEKEEKVRRLTRVQAVLSGINTLIVRVRGRDELFREGCRIAVEAGAFKMAWIGIVDKEAGIVKPIAFAGDVRDFFEAAPPALMESKAGGIGLNGRAVRDMKPMISNDVLNDPHRLMKKEMEERGINSLAVIPLIVGAEAIGVFALYSADAGFFDDEEMRLLQELAGDIAFAIDHIDKLERLDFLAYYDSLTGLANQSLFLERLQEKLLSAPNDPRKKVVFVLDIERFKTINDAFGRAAGDELLKQVAARLVQVGGDASRFARIGPDRFAIAASDLDNVEQVGRYTEQRLDAVFRGPFRVGDNDLRVSAKMGIALFPDDGADADTLLRNAEAALKKAKGSGERYLFFTQAMTERIAERLSLENKLRQALESEEFVLHYQPKVNLVSGKLTGAEALIRWNDPRTGLVPPGRFIPILEETGLIHEVGRWALRKAIEEHLRWRAAGLTALRIAVNVSPLQLRNRGFIDEVKQAIGIDPHAAAGLELEITESLIMEDVKHSIASLQAIRAMGVTVAIDDFGTGFSSLSYLSKLPVDTLKIDRSFVIDMTAGPEGLALVSTIVNLAHSLKLKVVAEGVETEEQSRLLRLLGCDEMQGFLFSEAVPGAIFETSYLPPASAAARSL